MPFIMGSCSPAGKLGFCPALTPEDKIHEERRINGKGYEGN
jgi:hypothetical protein